jgi:hypothetical protein
MRQHYSPERPDQRRPAAGTASEFNETTAATTGDRTTSDDVDHLLMAGAAVAIGLAAPTLSGSWAEVLHEKSDTGTGTSTASLTTAQLTPTAGADALTVTFDQSTTRARAMVMVEVAVAAE